MTTHPSDPGGYMPQDPDAVWRPDSSSAPPPATPYPQVSAQPASPAPVQPPAPAGPYPPHFASGPGYLPNDAFPPGGYPAPFSRPPILGLATAGFVLGVCSTALSILFVCLWPLLSVTLISGVIAIILSAQALRQIRAAQGALDGHGLAVAGLVTGIIGTALSALLFAILVIFRVFS